MADVENVSLGTAVVTAASTTVSVSGTTDIPITQGLSVKLNSAGEVESDLVIDGNQISNNDLGTSPTQEKSSNSHPHDSEYDTASDLEGNEDYDDEEDDMDESLTDDDDDSESETDTDDDEEDEDEDDEGVDLQGQEKIDAEAQKKVDEDRSNPQYIPKRGTFYEHDDRTAEVEGEPIQVEGQDPAESPVVVTGIPGSVQGVPGKSATAPIVSSASKTMKKWQPASAVDRWSHDRFDLSEQAPKSRSELVNSYGYDIRTEDAPPKARRRRRYGRGPSKYNRNWEDEGAYLKTNNKERKPPKPSDFPALNENSSRPRRVRRTRDEKENRMERRQREGRIGRGEEEGERRSERPEKIGPQRNLHMDDHDHRGEPRQERGERNDVGGYKQQNRQKTNYNNNRQQGQGNNSNNQASFGRQAAMEFKQKNRQHFQNSSPVANTGPSTLANRLEAQRQPQQQQQQMTRNSTNVQNSKHNQSGGQQYHQQNDNYNNKKKHLEQGYQPMQNTQHSPSPQQQNMQQQQPPTQTMVNHNANRQNPQLQTKVQQPTSNLSQRLQQVQNRNDPSHVGSVQMHALASQNQQQQQQQQMIQQQQQVNNIMMGGPPQQTQHIQQQSVEQRGPPKRYSSLRRSQHEAQHIADQHQQLQQQLHLQQQQHQNQAPPSMLMPAEQAIMQANLIQMYHQENLQAQMQALQVTQQPNVAKQPGYGAQGQQQPPPQAYYVASPEAYTTVATAAATAQASQAAATYAAQQPNPTYLAQQQTVAAAAASLAYNNPNNAPQQSAVAAAAAAAYAPTNQVGVVPQTQTASGPTSGFPNYNTVGGTTYFVPPVTQTPNRPVSLPQRRPTNAIPILPPSEKNKQKSQQQDKPDDTKVAASNGATQVNQPPVGSAENIDHIIDNMFVQRPAFQPPPATTTNPASKLNPTTSSEAIAPDNANSTNTPSQDNTLAAENLKATNDTSSNVAPASSLAATESSNNNQISAQE